MASPLTINEVLGRNGVLSRRLSDFRERPQQLSMAAAVEEAFVDKRHLLVEAPTGVGKSLAYLVPTVLNRVGQGRKVVISTHTIALQEQLLERDLPLLGASLPIEFVAVKAMGRNNYLSRRRLAVALANAPTLFTDDDEVRRLRSIEAWAADSSEGTRQDLPTAPGVAWEHVRSEADNCLGRRCSTYNSCFFQAARRRLENADLIVTNHALYFTDLMLRTQDAGILPDHDALILDEAHHVEHVAAEHFGLELSRAAVYRVLRRISSGHTRIGLLHRLEGARISEAVALVARIRGFVGEFFTSLGAWLSDHPQNHARIREPHCVEDRLSQPLLQLSNLLEDLLPTCRNDSEEIELMAWSGRTRYFGETVQQLLSMEDPGLVYFVEGEEAARDMALVARPLDVASLLERRLFANVDSVVLTSATLATSPGEEGLSYKAERLGCPDADTLCLGTPFDFASNVEVVVPAGLPLPDEPDFDNAAGQAVLAGVRESGGGAFILFTSYRALEACHQAIVGPLTKAGLLVLRQGGAMDRRQLLDAFRADGNAVLLGADSFWEGVDVPGPALRLLVIVRLPFPVPTRPLHAARAEAIRHRGGSSFAGYFLPEAVIRFRQGFGRLVRTEKDGGRVICLDRRVLLRGYGRRFQNAIPQVPWQKDVAFGTEKP